MDLAGPGRLAAGSLYYYSGFALLQDLLQRAVVDFKAGREVAAPATYLQQMPVNAYKEDLFVLAIARTTPLFMTLGTHTPALWMAKYCY